jgi:hypothetical protein
LSKASAEGGDGKSEENWDSIVWFTGQCMCCAGK